MRQRLALLFLCAAIVAGGGWGSKSTAWEYAAQVGGSLGCGLGMGAGAGLVGALAGFGLGSVEGDYALIGALVGIGVGYPVGTALGARLVGQAQNRGEGFLGALGGSLVGIGLSAGMAALSGRPGFLNLGVVLCPAGSVIGYSLTRRGDRASLGRFGRPVARMKPGDTAADRALELTIVRLAI